MKYFWFLLFLLFSCFVSEAQYHVVLKLGKYPLQHNKDTVFLSGSFNNWNPRNSDWKFLLTDENKFEFTVELPAGEYEYKCTRGSWKKVESDMKGSDLANHTIEIKSDTTITINIAAWKDDFVTVARKHTASKHVRIMDTAFYMPQLDRYRRIWVYLPEGYTQTKKHYPVLYMHDGQNLFEAATSAFGEWGVDECLDSMISAGKKASIVVGIDNGPERMNEYNPFEFQNFGKGEAEQYIGFITETLKPYIDKKYRTISNNENTIIAGSSMGGLVSYYAVLLRPDVFGKAGIFSPAFWTAPEIISMTDSLASKVSSKFFFYIGEKEGDSFVKDMTDLLELLGEKSQAMIYSVVDPTGRHNERAWRKWFPEFYTWMMANGFNTVIKLNN